MPTELTWQKSSFSGGGEGNECIGFAAAPTTIHTTRLTTTRFSEKPPGRHRGEPTATRSTD